MKNSALTIAAITLVLVGLLVIMWLENSCGLVWGYLKTRSSERWVAVFALVAACLVYACLIHHLR